MARPKHRSHPGATYFVTTNTWQRRSAFYNAEAALMLQTTIFSYRDAGEYFVHSYVIMPNHLHVILTPGNSTTLERAAGLIKGGSSYEIGQRFGGHAPVWQPGFAEHQIRDYDDFRKHVRYIEENPVKAGLVEKPELYPYGSANGNIALDPWPLASGAKAPGNASLAAGLKPRPSVSRADVSPAKI